MRSVKRIDVVTDLLNQVWKKYPDLRLWQLQELLCEYIPEDKKETDPFFWEEGVWITMLEGALNGKKS